MSINISCIYKSYRIADLNFNECESRDSSKRPSRFLLVMNFHLASFISTHIYAFLCVYILCIMRESE